MDNALQGTHKYVQQALDDPDLGTQQAFAQSTAGRTTTDNVETKADGESKIKLLSFHEQWKEQAKKRMESERLLFEQCVGQTDRTTGSCLICSTSTGRKCSICDNAWFCGATCERTYTVQHPTQCLSTSSENQSALWQHCTVCSMPYARLCRTCRDIAWCSPKCYLHDKRVHDQVCEQYARVRYSHPSVPADFFLGFNLPSSDNVPTFVWVRCPDRNNGAALIEDVSNILWCDETSVNSRKISHSHGVHKLYEKYLVHFYSTDHANDKTVVCKGIDWMTGSSKAQIRQGPALILVKSGMYADDLKYGSGGMDDFRMAIEYVAGILEDRLYDMKLKAFVVEQCEGHR